MMQSKFILGSALLVLVAMASSCSAPLSTREQGGLKMNGNLNGSGARIKG
jgi:hypothetical protein